MRKRRLSPSEWLHHLRTVDQVPDFLKAGGSIVRVVTSHSQPVHKQLTVSLDSFAASHDFRLLRVSHETCPRLQYPHEIIASLVPSLEIESLFRGLARRAWVEAGFDGDGHALSAVQERTRESRSSLRREFKRALRSLLPPGEVLNHEFTRAAQEVVTDVVESPEQALAAIKLFESYLLRRATQSELVALGVLRKITRSNATPTLKQLVALNHVGGWPASVLHLDLRWTSDHESLDSLVGPTRMARRDLYQWVREIIDLTPGFRSAFVCVEFGPTFLDPSPTGRGFGSYDALRLRLDDGVKPRGGPNPSAALVPLEIP